MILAAILAELPQEVHDAAALLHGKLKTQADAESQVGQIFEAVVSGLQMLRDHPTSQASLNTEIHDLTQRLAAALHLHVAAGLKAAAVDAPAPAA